MYLFVPSDGWRGVETPQRRHCAVDKAHLRSLVGEAHAHVQGASLKAWALSSESFELPGYEPEKTMLQSLMRLRDAYFGASLSTVDHYDTAPPTEVMELLRAIAESEKRGYRWIYADQNFSAEAIEYARKAGFVDYSTGSWQDDGIICGLMNKGREAIGIPPVPTIWERIQTLFRRIRSRAA